MGEYYQGGKRKDTDKRAADLRETYGEGGSINIVGNNQKNININQGDGSIISHDQSVEENEKVAIRRIFWPVVSAIVLGIIGAIVAIVTGQIPMGGN